MITAAAVVLSVAMGLLVLAAAVAMIRLFLGPTALDRAVAVDVVSSCVIGIVIVLVAWRGRTDLMVLLIIFALTAFFSSVTVARFGVGSAIGRYRRQVESTTPTRAAPESANAMSVETRVESDIQARAVEGRDSQ